MPSRSLAPLAPTLSSPAVGGELVHPEELASLAGEVAARQRTRNTRRTYAACYRQFVALLVVRLGRPPRRGDLTALTVRAYRDQLEADGRTAATIAHHLSALRRLAAELDADPAIQRVRADRVAPREPRALVAGEYAALLAVPDRRSRAGVRDLAVLYLLGDAGQGRARARPVRPTSKVWWIASWQRRSATVT